MAPTIMKFHAPRFRKKIAMFDYDGTLVRPKEAQSFPKDVGDWEWNYNSVAEILQKTYKQGFMIIICTQQTKPWKLDQIRAVLEPLQIPMYVSVATDKTDYKPSRAIFDAVVPTAKVWLREASFMVGDALGRNGDWSDCDRKFA
jgi:bifunctional polynucleotide phosphatase/kinase